MPATRRLAAIAGALYLLTFATSIPALALKAPFLAGTAGAGNAHWAAVLEVILALSCIGTAVALFPVTRPHSPALALGFVASRTLEAAMVFTGVIALLAISTVRGSGPSNASAPGAVDEALVAVHDWAFLLGPGLLPAANAVLLGTVLLRARLVPRVIPLVGLIGAPLLVASALATLFGLVDQVSPIAGLAALPIALWELSIGLWLLLRGVRADAVGSPAQGPNAPATTPVRPIDR